MNKIRADIAKLKEIPSKIDTDKTFHLIKQGESSKKYFGFLKSLTQEDDKEISEWLDISVKTFRSYKNTQKTTKPHLTEHVIMLISLVKHGLDVFGDYNAFKQWLEKGNFYFDKLPPINFISSISGMKFIDDRLTAMEFGDNA
ncbi:MAG TPA: DUF2384 domain-containing protein [Bacteroidia bacterium]|nr:DUF2384 domain-containing protein [Bacteroidia bacterium]